MLSLLRSLSAFVYSIKLISYCGVILKCKETGCGRKIQRGEYTKSLLECGGCVLRGRASHCYIYIQEL